MHILRSRLSEILEDAEIGLSSSTREVIAQLREELVRLDERVVGYDQRIERLAEQSEACQRLRTIKLNWGARVTARHHQARVTHICELCLFTGRGRTVREARAGASDGRIH